MAEDGKEKDDQDHGADGLAGFPKGGEIITLTDFNKGLNTRSPRMSIDDQELAWVENFFPISRGNLRTLPGPGSSIYTAPNGKTIIYFSFYNFGSTQYVAVFLSDGTAVQVNTNTLATTTISSTANTFFNGGSFPYAIQWGSIYLLIASSVSTSGYYIWDGTNLYGAGTLAPWIFSNLTQGGTGYTSAPTVSVVGGSGSGATLSATVTNGSVTSVNITNPGSGYLVTDTVQLSFSGGSPTAGSLITVNILNGGTGYTSAPTASISGGGGTGATLGTVVISGGAVTSIPITAAGSGYTGTPTISFSGGGGSGAIAHAVISTVADGTVSLMPFGVAGNQIEIYQSRVWVSNGSTIQITDPSSVSLFRTVIQSTDYFLRQKYICLKQSNGFLYLIGDSSVNTVNNVQTTGSAGATITTFTNQNVDPQVGTPWRDSVVPFGRDIIFANTNGIYVMFGGAAEKVSEKLDGIFATATLPLTGISNIPCAAINTVYGIKFYMLLATVVDSFTGSSVPKLLCWDGRKWFLGSQGVNLTFINTQEIESNLDAWGTDGTNLYNLFAVPSSTLVKNFRGKLWPGHSYLIIKQLLRIYIEAFDNIGAAFSANIYVDTDSGVSSAATLAAGGIINFVNSSGGVINFVNSTSGVINFTVPGVSIVGSDFDSYGKMLGFSFTSTSTDFTVVNMSMLYKDYTFYG